MRVRIGLAKLDRQLTEMATSTVARAIDQVMRELSANPQPIGTPHAAGSTEDELELLTILWGGELPAAFFDDSPSIAPAAHLQHNHRLLKEAAGKPQFKKGTIR
ncbi:hypothetical protein [Pseudomonas putida]